MKSHLLFLFATTSCLFAADSLPTAISAPEQLWRILPAAKKLVVTGTLPSDPKPDFSGYIELVRLPMTVTRPEDIRAVLALLRVARLEPDAAMTAAVRRGEALATAIVADVTIDDRFTFTFVGSDCVRFGDTFYHSTRRESLARDVALVLGRSQNTHEPRPK